MRTQQKIALGAAMAAIAGTLMALTPVLGWASAPRPWSFLFGFLVGLLAGLGATLAIHGFIENRRGK